MAQVFPLGFLTTAELSILATVVVALAGFAFNALSFDRDRKARAAQAVLEHEHAERLGRSERTFRIRADAYAEAAQLLRIQQLVVWRADPYMHPDEASFPDLKDVIREDEWARIMGRIAVHSSPDALAALEDVRQRMNSLALAMTALRASQRAALREQDEVESGRVDRGPDFNPWRAPGLVKSQEGVEKCRQSAYEAIDAAEAVMRAELLAV